MARRGTITVDVNADLDENSVKRVGQEAKKLLELIESDIDVNTELNEASVDKVEAQIIRTLDAFKHDFEVNPNLDERAFQRINREINQLMALTDANIEVDAVLDDKSVAEMTRRLTTLIEAFEATHRLNLSIDEEQLESVGSRMSRAVSKGLNENLDVGPFNLTMKTVLAAAAVLVPVAVELGIAASGAALGIGAMGVAAGVAGVGIFRLVKDGGIIGETLTAGFRSAKEAFFDLSDAVAPGLAPGLNKSLNILTNGMGLLEDQFVSLAPVIGNTISNLVEGLVGLLIQMEPVTTRVAAAVEDLSERFRAFGTGQGGADFVDRILQSFNDMMPLLKSLGSLFGNVFGGAAGAFAGLAPAITLVVGFIDNLVTHFRGLFDTITGGGEVTKGFTSILGPVLDLLDAFIGGIVSGASAFKFLFQALGFILQGIGKLFSVLNIVLKPIAAFVGWIIGGVGAVGKALKAFALLFKALSKIGVVLKVAAAPLRLVLNIFSGIGRGIGPIVQGFGRFIGSVPGLSKIGSAIQAIGRVFSNLGSIFSSIGSKVMKVIDGIVSGVKAIPGQIGGILTNLPLVGGAFKLAGNVAGKAFGAIKSGFEGVTKAAGAVGGAIKGFFGGGEDEAKKTEQALARTRAEALLATGDIEGLSAALNDMDNGDRVAIIGEAMAALREETGLTSEAMDGIAASFGLTADAVADGTVSLEDYTTLIEGVNHQLQNGPPSATQFIKALGDFSTSAGTAADKASLFQSFLVKLRGEALENVGSMLAVKTGIVGVRDAMIDLGPNLGKAVKEIIALSTGSTDLGTVWDTKLLGQISTLQSAFQSQSDAAHEAARRIFEMNVESKGTEGAARIATQALQKTHEALRKQAESAGLSDDQTRKLLRSLGLIPPDVKTTARLFGKETVEGILEDIRDLFVSVFKQQGYNTDVVIKDKTPGGSGGFLGNIQGWLNNIAKTYTAHVSVQGGREVSAGNARGTNNWRGGWSWVGEEGPELMRLPRGTQIKSNPASVAMARGAEHFADGTGGVSYGDISVTISVDDLDKMSKVSDFLAMLDKSRVTARKTLRSGTVTA